MLSRLASGSSDGSGRGDMHLWESCSSAPGRMMRHPFKTKGNCITDLLSMFAQDGEQDLVSKDDAFATGYSAPPRMRARRARTVVV